MKKSRKLINLLGVYGTGSFLACLRRQPWHSGFEARETPPPLRMAAVFQRRSHLLSSLWRNSFLSDRMTKRLALICLDRDGARDFITLTFYQQPTVSQLLERIFEDDVSWKEKK